VLSRRVVRFAYRDARGRARQGYLAPYTMLLYKHGLYVVGCRLREPTDGRAIEPGTRIAVYAVERFTEADHLRNAPFAAPPGFRIDEILNGAFGIHVMTDALPHRVWSSSAPRRRPSCAPGLAPDAVRRGALRFIGSG